MTHGPRRRRWRLARRAARSGVELPDGAVDVAAAADVPSQPPFLPVTVGGVALLLARTAEGHVVAFDAACPHLGQPLRRARLEADVLECRFHAHAYELRGGRCVRPGSDRDEPLELREAGEVDGRVWVRP